MIVQQCGGRFNLGLAAGSDECLRWVGLEQARPLVRVREASLAVRAALRGEPQPGPALGPDRLAAIELMGREGLPHFQA